MPPFLKWNGNAWEAPLVLAPGEYAYKLVVNGEEVLDPSNEVTVPNGFGSFNNVLTVEGGGGEAPVAIDFQFVHEGALRFSSIPEDQEVLAFFNNRVIDVVRDEDGLSIADSCRCRGMGTCMDQIVYREKRPARRGLVDPFEVWRGGS